MNYLVNVNNISKKYRLGATRTSILSFVKSSLLRPGRAINPQQIHDRELWALKDVKFTLTKGESLGLIGKNGAGKSTLLKLLAKVTYPTSGTIDIKGRLSALIELGSGFHPDLSGRENIYLNGTILGLSRKEISQRFDEIVDFSEIERFIDTPVKRYSSGMLVRLGFSVASCIEPEILLVDEVLAVGDASFRQKCLQRINELLSNGTSIIFVSHNLYMVQAVCPKSLYIVNGMVKFAGNTSQAIGIYERDLHEEKAMKFEHQGTSNSSRSDISITKVELIDPDTHQSPRELEPKRPAQVNIYYDASGSNLPANAVVRIVRTDGVTCCMMRTSIDNAKIILSGYGGTISVLLNPLQLAGGSYFVDARITNESDNVVLSSSWSEWFYVAGSSLSYEEQSGVYEPQRNWLV